MPVAPGGLHRRGIESRRDRAQKPSPFRSRARRSAVRRNRGCATCCRPAPAMLPLPHPAQRAAPSEALPPAKHSCPFSLPIALERRIGGEQLLGADVRIVEVHAHAEVAPFARNGAYGPTAELAVTHAFSFDVTWRVLRNVLRKRELRQQAARRGAAWPRGPRRHRPRRTAQW